MLPQARDHLGLQPTPRLSVDRGIDRLMADAGGRVIRVHEPKSLRNLLRRPPSQWVVADQGHELDAGLKVLGLIAINGKIVTADAARTVIAARLQRSWTVEATAAWR